MTRLFTTSVFILLMCCVSVVSRAHDKVILIPLLGGGSERAPSKVFVASSQGDFNNLPAAMASINNASPSNPYDIIVAPGVYSLQSSLLVKPYVHIKGSGRFATIIEGSVAGTSQSNGALIIGSNNASVQDLTLVNETSAGAMTVGITNFNATMDIINVDIIVEGVDDAIGIFNSGASPQIKNVRSAALSINDTAYGIWNNISSPIMENVELSGTGYRGYGLFHRTNSGGVMKNSILFGTTFALQIISSAASTRIEDTLIEGASHNTPAGAQCFFTYDNALQPVNC